MKLVNYSVVPATLRQTMFKYYDQSKEKINLAFKLTGSYLSISELNG